MSRFPRRVYDVGTEPDARFSLANERTFLAWVRTALALIATGVAAEALAVPVQETLRAIAAGVFVTMGLVAAIQAWVGWARAERSMRLATPLPAPHAGMVLVTGVVIGTVLLALGWLL